MAVLIPSPASAVGNPSVGRAGPRVRLRLPPGPSGPVGAGDGRPAPEDASASSGAVVCCLGYPLFCPPAELAVLRALIGRAGDGLSPEALCGLAGAASTAALAVHVNRLNRRAEALTGRRLILCDPRRGYLLNPYL